MDHLIANELLHRQPECLIFRPLQDRGIGSQVGMGVDDHIASRCMNALKLRSKFGHTALLKAANWNDCKKAFSGWFELALERGLEKEASQLAYLLGQGPLVRSIFQPMHGQGVVGWAIRPSRMRAEGPCSRLAAN